jgi:hypothetical protein
MIRAVQRSGTIVAVALCWATAVSAHDLERTQIALTFAADGSFVLDISNDPDWLLLRLESFAGGRVAAGVTPAMRDARLRELGRVFLDRVVLFVDGREIRPESAEYEPPRAQLASDALPPLATFRLRGRMPATARTLRWLYGLVIDPYALTIHRADGRALVEVIEGSNWSSVLDLSGQFRQRTWLDVTRDYIGRQGAHVLPSGLDPIVVLVALFLVSVVVRLRTLRS